LFCKGKDEENNYRTIFGCEVGSLPFKYLGIPIHYRTLFNKEWKPIEDQFENNFAFWLGKLLSYGDQSVLINLVLSSLPMFLLLFFAIPTGVRKILDFYRSRFFWKSDELKKKYRLTKWNIICRLKDQEGLGIEVLDTKNWCLLCKWLFKLLPEEEAGKELLSNKYLCGKMLSQVQAKSADSPFFGMV
jgi:hypothetical protein